jgi:hypothetical protein
MAEQILPEMQDISRQRDLAKMLLQKGMSDNLQGQMVSGRYVGASPWQGIANMYAAYTGGQMAKEADRKQAELAEMLRQQTMQDIQAYGQAVKGTPEQTVYGAGEEGPTMNVTPAVAPDPEKGLGILMGSRSPQSQALAQALLADQMKTIIVPEGGMAIRGGFGGAGQTIKGTPKVSQDLRDAAREAKLNIDNIDNWTPQDWTKVRAIEANTAALKRPKVEINMPSEGERKAGFMSNILDRNILQMQTALGVDPTAVKPNVAASIVESLTGPNLLSRSMKPEQRQIVEDSQLDVLDAALTLRTGAAYTREQLNAMRDTYFPVLGDKPPAIAAKKQRLETLLEGAYIASGRATPKRVSAPVGDNTPSLPNPNKPTVPTQDAIQAEINRRLGLTQQGRP